MKYIKQFIELTDGLAEPLRRGFLRTIDTHSVHQTKEQAVAFAKKYLEVRKKDYTKFHTFFQDEVSGIDIDDANEALERTWNIATEYILLDIIPHIYGEALD